MGIRSWVAAAAVSVCAGSAGAATHTVVFPPTVAGFGSATIDGVLISVTPSVAPVIGKIADEGGSTHSDPTSITFSTGGAFTPVRIDIPITGTSVVPITPGDTPACGPRFEGCPYVNILITAATVGGSSVSAAIDASLFPTYIFGSEFANITSLILTALVATPPVGYYCSDNACSTTYFNNLVLVDVASAVPEASTWAMMLLGLAGLTLVQSHRRYRLSA